MRIPLSNLGSVRIVDATAKRKGVLLQNVDATNTAIISEDQRSLDSLDAAGNPTVGFSLPSNMAQPISITTIRGALYARGKGGTVQLEVYEYDVDDDAIPVTGLERMNRRRFPYVNKG